jgi:addiction module HigA family antidote
MRAVHPGEILREDILPEVQMSESKLAEHLNICRMTVNRLVNERQAVSPDMALRLSRLFGNSPDFWLNLQNAYDLKKAEHSMAAELKKIKPLPAVV